LAIVLSVVAFTQYRGTVYTWDTICRQQRVSTAPRAFSVHCCYQCNW